MKRFLAYLKWTLVDGAVLLLPAWLAVLLLAKVVLRLEVLVKPVSSHLPASIDHPRLIAIALFLVLCFAVGLFIHTVFGARLKRVTERLFLEKIPGYTTIRSFAARLSDSKENAGFQPALVEIEEALVPGFIVERHNKERSTVFVPSAPTPMAGTIYVIDNRRVHPLDVSVMAMMQCVARWGGGASKLVAAYDTAFCCGPSPRGSNYPPIPPGTDSYLPPK